jgi:hypothetical protein
MKQQDAENQNSLVDQDCGIRNPFGVMDVPNPNDQEVLEFAADAKLAGTSDDENAKAWTPQATAVIAARSKEIGPAGGMVAPSPQSREMPRTNGNRVNPK